ncbi:MAG: Holliday junction resolvase-like protein [Candidatus Pacearchaeota archaeon]|jgi:predicted Holliday junction resolvase-like endonuclease
MDLEIIFLGIIFLIGVFIAFWIGLKFGKFTKHREWEKNLPDYRREAIKKSRAVLGGQFSEQLAPYLPNFPYLPTECKFLGKPIDLICFKGLDEKEIDEIIFIEVKSGKSRLNSVEKKLKKAINEKKVKWREYRIPEELTEAQEFVEDEI